MPPMSILPGQAVGWPDNRVAILGGCPSPNNQRILRIALISVVGGSGSIPAGHSRIVWRCRRTHRHRGESKS